MSRPGLGPASLRPPLHRVGAPGAVGRAGGRRGRALALVLRTSRVRTPGARAHSTETEKCLTRFFFKSQTFSVFLSPSLEAVEFHPFYGYLRPDNALGYSAVSEKFIIL